MQIDEKRLHPARGNNGEQKLYRVPTTTNCFQGTLKSDARSSDTLVGAFVTFCSSLYWWYRNFPVLLYFRKANRCCECVCTQFSLLHTASWLLCVCVCACVWHTPACWVRLTQVWYFYINRWCAACLGSLQQRGGCYARWVTVSRC